MKINKLWLVTISILFLLSYHTIAQKKKAPVKKPAKKTVVQTPKTEKPKVTSPPKENVNYDASQDEKKVRDMVSFLEYMLNTIGSSSTSRRDKDVLVTESYAKIFRDAKVQVEDDLDQNRTVITNKDVTAYLKDVDFFFSDVHFEFIIDGIQSGQNADNKLFYKVSLKRNLKGITTDGKAVNNLAPRFIEINYDPQDQDLRIASIYTNEINEKDALINWWKQLSLEWQEIFARKINHTDSITLTQISQITSLEDLDISGNTYVQSIDPLGRLTRLKSLHLSKTTITDLNPIRNLTELVELDLSYTPVQDLSALRYSDKMTKLMIGNTSISDITVIEKMPLLQSLDISNTGVTYIGAAVGLSTLSYLNLSGTKITDFSTLESLTQITELNVSRTLIRDLNPLKAYKNLKTLTIDSTRIQTVAPLSTADNLAVLHANATQIADLKPLQKLAHLEKIYCDQTAIDRAAADAFMAANPKVLVVFASQDLKSWWDKLTPPWQEIISAKAKITATPAKEELAKVALIDSIDVSGTAIRDLEPLKQLQKLRAITVSKTSINDLTALQEHKEIVYLDISNTEVSDISVAQRFTKLKELRADKTKIENIDALASLRSLKKLYLDETPVHDIIAREFLEKNPECLIIYKTLHLKRWWGMLSAEWKEVFRGQMNKDTVSNRENLHLLAEQSALHFKDAAVNDLSALSEFVRLKELHFSGTNISSVPVLESLNGLKSLHAVSSPIQKIETISKLTALEDLDISNTPVDDLKAIAGLSHLKKFNCAGTQIKKLDALENLQDLESLDCSNTRVGSLDGVSSLPLKVLKCYNTKISSREIENFKKSHTDCNVVYYR